MHEVSMENFHWYWDWSLLVKYICMFTSIYQEKFSVKSGKTKPKANIKAIHNVILKKAVI